MCNSPAIAGQWFVSVQPPWIEEWLLVLSQHVAREKGYSLFRLVCSVGPTLDHQ